MAVQFNEAGEGYWFDDPPTATEDAPEVAASPVDDFTFSGSDLLDTGGGFVSEPDARPTYSNPDPTARQVGVDNATGNPVWQLIDKGGSILEWAVDRAGAAVGLKSVGTVAQDARLTYANPDPTARKVGTDTATGNPIWQLTDAGGNIVQWAVDWMGNALDTKYVGTANPTTPKPNTINTGGGPTDILTDILTGDGGNKGGSVINIVNQTDNRPTTKTKIDASVRNTTTTNTNISNNLNSADLVSNVVKSIADIFKSGNPPIQASSAVNPMNDSLFGYATTPKSRQAGMSLDGGRMTPGSNATPQQATATANFSGKLGSALTNENNRPLLYLGIALTVVAIFFTLRRRV
jgi:hypothetical protein